MHNGKVKFVDLVVIVVCLKWSNCACTPSEIDIEPIFSLVFPFPQHIARLRAWAQADSMWPHLTRARKYQVLVRDARHTMPEQTTMKHAQLTCNVTQSNSDFVSFLALITPLHRAYATCNGNLILMPMIKNKMNEKIEILSLTRNESLKCNHMAIEWIWFVFRTLTYSLWGFRMTITFR